MAGANDARLILLCSWGLTPWPNRNKSWPERLLVGSRRQEPTWDQRTCRICFQNASPRPWFPKLKPSCNRSSSSSFLFSFVHVAHVERKLEVLDSSKSFWSWPGYDDYVFCFDILVQWYNVIHCCTLLYIVWLFDVRGAEGCQRHCAGQLWGGQCETRNITSDDLVDLDFLDSGRKGEGQDWRRWQRGQQWGSGKRPAQNDSKMLSVET